MYITLMLTVLGYGFKDVLDKMDIQSLRNTNFFKGNSKSKALDENHWVLNVLFLYIL